MSPENIPAILGGLTDGVVGAVLGFLFALLLFRLTKKRKLVEYSVSSISLFRLKPSVDSVLTVSVSKETLSGNPADHNEMLPLNTVYGFQILLNVGNEDIEKIDDIEIRLDTAAKIVRCETDPLSTPGYPITTRIEPAYFNVLYLSVPYLNAKTKMVIRLITTENTDSSCTVMVHGVGIRTRSSKSSRAIVIIGSVLYFTFTIISLILISLDVYAHHLPFFYNDPLSWSALILLFVAMFTFIYIVLSVIIQATRQKFSQDWDWEVPQAEKKQNFLQKWFS